MATTSARAGSGANRRCTRSRRHTDDALRNGHRRGALVATPVSLVEVHATLLDVDECDEAVRGRGESLLDLIERKQDSERVVNSEYHAAGAKSGVFMLRRGAYKYVH